ncbi:hypothetical protein D3C80_1861660 [compost metagenome]
MLIDLDHLQIIGRLHFKEGFHQTDAGVVEHAVQRPQPVHGEVDHGLDLFSLRDIDLEGMSPAPQGLNLAGDGFGARKIEVSDDQVRALARQRQTGFTPDAAGAAGDDNDLVLEFHYAISFD